MLRTHDTTLGLYLKAPLKSLCSLVPVICVISTFSVVRWVYILIWGRSQCSIVFYMLLGMVGTS
ncbi:hypothetical protein BDZ91DRAFT_730848 [Kalaharituber pfeilii]|nr:hypothetical protein BDZ91DRAFT_730848 [Kalaharituber pfeilii]